MPVNPERPMNAKTCREALDRVEEAARNSPLLNRKENERHLGAALRQARRLCVRK